MGKSYSIPKAQERVEQLKIKVYDFHGTMASKSYKRLQMKLVKTNEKIIKLQEETQQTEECNKLLRDVEICLQKLTDKVTAHSTPNPTEQKFTTSSTTLNYDLMEKNYCQDMPETSKKTDEAGKVLPPVVKPSGSNADTSFTIRPPIPVSDDVTFRTRENENERNILPPIPTHDVPGIYPPSN